MMMCKSLLGKNTFAPICLRICYQERIRMGIGNEILLESCQNSVENQGWLRRIKQTLESNEMSNVYDEIHFLFTCPTYTHLRRFLDPASNSFRSFQYLPHDTKLQALLSIMESDTCKFIAYSNDLRTFLMSQPKNMD